MRANIENKGFRLRWKTIWDNTSPANWKAFLATNNGVTQGVLRNRITAIQADPNTKPAMAASYRNFVSGLCENYCKKWIEMPGDDVYEEMYGDFTDISAQSILDEFFNESTTTFIPSRITDVLYEQFYSLLSRFIAPTTTPLSLVNLCRMTLKAMGPSKLIDLFRSISDTEIRERLFHVKCDE